MLNLKRPKPSEGESEILNMQEEFIRNKSSNPGMQPAAQVCNLQSQTSKKTSDAYTPKKSKYAEMKGLRGSIEECPRAASNASSIVGDILEKNQSEDKIEKESEVNPILLKDIVEKYTNDDLDLNFDNMPQSGFPVASFHVVRPSTSRNRESMETDQAASEDRKKTHDVRPSTSQNRESMETDQAASEDRKKNLPSRSYVISSSLKESEEIHHHNIKRMNLMTDREILIEQKILLEKLDPKLINFTKTLRDKKEPDLDRDIEDKKEKVESNGGDISGLKSYRETIETLHFLHTLRETLKPMEGSDEVVSADNSKLAKPEIPMEFQVPTNSLKDVNNINMVKDGKSTNSSEDVKNMDSLVDEEILWHNDILSDPNLNKWLHFDSLEKNKLEWMKGIEVITNLQPDKPYEARFDFKGYLLPYSLEYTEETKTLFHHGDEQHRPGYSLGELFQLSRSSVTQQRVIALNVIADILYYYNLGIYNGVIDLPLSKIFFIIRTSVDENKVILLEPALKALRNLICNRMEDAYLDSLTGLKLSYLGGLPVLNERVISDINETECNISDMKDYQLAEIDMIATLLRSNILQRIYYILEFVKPNYNCVHFSLQILIRMARDSDDRACSILDHKQLIATIIKYFVPISSVNFSFVPQIAYAEKPILEALKLFRVLSEYDDKLILVNKHDFVKCLAQYLSSSIDRSYGMKIQIEAFCILCNLIDNNLSRDAMDIFIPIILKLIFLHVKGTDIFVHSSTLSTTHASVVLQTAKRLFSNKINDELSHKVLVMEGVQKWMAQLAQSESYTSTHLQILCAALEVCSNFVLDENSLMEQVCESLKKFSNSKGFRAVIKQMIPCSNLLSGIGKNQIHYSKNMKSFEISVIEPTHKILPILDKMSPFPFMESLSYLLLLINNKEARALYVEAVGGYISKLANTPLSLCDNWFTRIETEFLYNFFVIARPMRWSMSMIDTLYKVAHKLCYVINCDKMYQIEYLFNHVVFSKEWFSAEKLMKSLSLSDADEYSEALSSIEDIRVCYSTIIYEYNFETIGEIYKPLLSRDWIYMPILNLYKLKKKKELEKLKEQRDVCKSFPVPSQNSKDHVSRKLKQRNITAEFAVRCSLEWILVNEITFPDLIQDMDITERFCKILCTFLCEDSLFLDPKIKLILRKCIQTLFKMEKSTPFDFDKKVTGLGNFHDMYKQILEEFQAVSYGDPTFAACVLVPLAQKYDVKWRKILWSEYAGCLRALDCPEEMLCYELNEYLYPIETNRSLIMSYHQALSGNLLRPNTIAYKIAEHHVRHFKVLSKKSVTSPSALI